MFPSLLLCVWVKSSLEILSILILINLKFKLTLIKKNDKFSLNETKTH